MTFFLGISIFLLEIRQILNSDDFQGDEMPKNRHGFAALLILMEN